MLIEDNSRLYSSKMEYYRHVYRDSKRWNGVESLQGKKLIVYCEQGLGDSIQFLRYIPLLKEYGCEVFVHVLPELHILCKYMDGIDHVLDRHDPILPEHDYHIPSLSIPFALNQKEAPGGYIHITEKEELPEEYRDVIKIGITWEGNPGHSNNSERSCPLRHFRVLHDLPNVKLFCLQKTFHLPELLKGAEDLEIMGATLDTFYDTAKLINAMDLIVTVDTSILHLAGALETQIPTLALMSYREDPRWKVHEWYRNIVFLRQPNEGGWEEILRSISHFLPKLI